MAICARDRCWGGVPGNCAAEDREGELQARLFTDKDVYSEVDIVSSIVMEVGGLCTAGLEEFGQDVEAAGDGQFEEDVDCAGFVRGWDPTECVFCSGAMI